MDQDTQQKNLPGSQDLTSPNTQSLEFQVLVPKPQFPLMAPHSLTTSSDLLAQSFLFPVSGFHHKNPHIKKLSPSSRSATHPLIKGMFEFRRQKTVEE